MDSEEILDSVKNTVRKSGNLVLNPLRHVFDTVPESLNNVFTDRQHFTWNFFYLIHNIVK